MKGRFGRVNKGFSGGSPCAEPQSGLRIHPAHGMMTYMHEGKQYIVVQDGEFDG